MEFLCKHGIVWRDCESCEIDFAMKVAEEDMPDLKIGLYQKFIVHRTDREDGEGGRHYDCEYFVLDLDHDPHAKAAIKAYADSCRADYPELAADLDKALERCRFSRDWKR